jgi:hypothetical protein
MHADAASMPEQSAAERGPVIERPKPGIGLPGFWFDIVYSPGKPKGWGEWQADCPEHGRARHLDRKEKVIKWIESHAGCRLIADCADAICLICCPSDAQLLSDIPLACASQLDAKWKKKCGLRGMLVHELGIA